VQLQLADDSRTVSSSRLAELVGSVGWAIIDAAPDGLLLVEPGGEIVLANRRAEGIFGYEHGGLLHRRVEELIPARLRAGHEGRRAAYAVAPVARPMGAGRLLRGLRADGVEVPVEVSLSPFNEGSARLTIATVRDISDTHMTREAAMELALLHERERIARGLLDSIIRRLFDIEFTLTSQIAQQHEVGHVDLTVIDKIDETIRTIREMIFDPRSPSWPGPNYS
jgi:PAS domain S-box-containing protein